MKRISALALLTVAAMGLSACGSEDSNDAADSGSAANASAQQNSAAKDENSNKDDSKKGSEADETTRAKSTKKSGPNPTPPASNHGSGHSSATESNNRAAEPTRGKRKRPSYNGEVLTREMTAGSLQMALRSAFLSKHHASSLMRFAQRH